MKLLNAVVILLLGLAAWPQAGRCAHDSDLTSAFLAARANVAAEKIVNHQPVFKASEMSAPGQDWQAILSKLQNQGKYVVKDAIRVFGNVFIPASFQLADVRGPKAAAHNVDYVSILGTMDKAGVFQPERVLFTSQD